MDNKYNKIKKLSEATGKVLYEAMYSPSSNPTNTQEKCCEKCIIGQVGMQKIHNIECPCHIVVGEEKIKINISKNHCTYRRCEELHLHTPPPSKEEWEKEFEDLWGSWDGAPEGSTKGLDYYLKEFISSLIARTKEEIVGEILKNKHWIFTTPHGLEKVADKIVPRWKEEGEYIKVDDIINLINQ